MEQNKQTHKISERYSLEEELNLIKHRIDEERQENMRETVFAINEITELVFLNFTGVPLKFCFSLFGK